MQGIVLLGDRDPRKRPPGAAGGIDPAPTKVGEPGQPVERLVDQIAGCDHVALGLLGNPEVPEGKRATLAEVSPVERDQIQTAAAHVADQAIGVGHPAENAGRPEPCFLVTAQDMDRPPEAFLDPCRERRPVFRLPDGGCRQQFQLADFHLLGEVDEPGQRRHGELHPIGVELSRFAQAPAQRAGDPLIENRNRQAAERVVNHETNGIGPDIDDGDTPGAVFRRQLLGPGLVCERVDLGAHMACGPRLNPGPSRASASAADAFRERCRGPTGSDSS